jgi:hypothetical protein
VIGSAPDSIKLPDCDPEDLPERFGGKNKRDIPEGGPVGPPKLRTKSPLGYVNVSRGGSHVLAFFRVRLSEIRK